MTQNERMMKYRVIERELYNGTIEYYVQKHVFFCIGLNGPEFMWFDNHQNPMTKEDAIAERDRLNGLGVKSEKEIE